MMPLFAFKAITCLGAVLALLWFTTLWQGHCNSIMMGQKGGIKNIFLPFLDGVRLLLHGHGGGQGEKYFYSLIITFLTLLTILLPFTVFPLCQAIWIGEEKVFLEYYHAEGGALFVWIIMLFNLPMAYLLKERSKSYFQELIFMKRVTNFICSFGVGLIILLSLFLTYQSFNFHTIVAKQVPNFVSFLPGWGLFRQPLAAILFFVVLQVGVGIGPFAIFDENDTPQLSGLRIFLLKLLQKMHTLSLVTLFVFIFMGGYSLIPGMDYIIKMIPYLLWEMQFFSLLLKIALVFLVLSLFKYSLVRYRSIDTVNLLFKRPMPLALGNLVLTFLLKSFPSGAGL